MPPTKQKIPVTTPYLPPVEEFIHYLSKIWESKQLTNGGPLLAQFEKSLSDYLEVRDFQFVANGTLALQLALSGLDINEGEVITTPFSYVATTSSILWQKCKPVYIDIDPETLCLDPSGIEAAITSNTKAIMPVHVFGNACDTQAIDSIASQHGIKVIYDAAHAFGVKYRGQSILSYGDASTLSFHATKLFHTIEGGGIICKDSQTSRQINLQKRFGHNGDDHLTLGINAKANEFQAAMGLTMLGHIDDILGSRKVLYELYDSYLEKRTHWTGQRIVSDVYNYSYYPIVFDTSSRLESVLSELTALDIYPRRYFYPSLNKLPYLSDHYQCPISESISQRVLCLPMYSGLEQETVKTICKVIRDAN